MKSFEERVAEVERWCARPRFEGITRLYSARQVAQQMGTIRQDCAVAHDAAEGLYERLRQLFVERQAVTTFGPYSPGQAVTMKRQGIEAIYLGGWATSAKGSAGEDPGPDLASYPLSQVPDEAATLVRALLTADKNQQFARSKMTQEERAAAPRTDFRPFIIADADTGHGGEAHVRNLIRRFVEVGVPGYHIEDQKPGAKKCGHQAGKVLVSQNEQIKRLNAARFQLDVMGVAGLIVARTDAEAATFLDSRADERDDAFLLGATSGELPSCRVASLAILKRFHQLGINEVNGHLLYRLSDAAYDHAFAWLKRAGVLTVLNEAVEAFNRGEIVSADGALDRVQTHFLDAWQMEAGLKTYPQAVADAMALQIEEGARFDMNVEEWRAFACGVSLDEARDKALSLGVNVVWNCELPRTPEGYYPIQGGIEYAIARSRAVAPFADLLWMETKTANLSEAKQFEDGVHAQFPSKMLAYNLSPSFNWDTTGMSDEDMQAFPSELGKLGYVFNFITYGGHQIDGVVAEEFSTALREDGMLALARLQRRLRLLDSPYKTPQALVGGPRLDAALMASTGGTATTKAMGKGSTHFQHLVQTEVPLSVLEGWLKLWAHENQVGRELHVGLRPHTAGRELLELEIVDQSERKLANVVFETILDRRNRSILSIRDQNTFEPDLRQRRLMTLAHLYLIHRYKSVGVHYLTPTEDNLRQTERMKELGLFSEVNTEVGEIIVARVNVEGVKQLLARDGSELAKLIAKEPA